jgi:low affinity Fe/Cu permease
MKSNNPSWFSAFAKKTSSIAGRPATFAIAVLMILVWAICGPAFHYSDTWQLVINTSTTIITFLMVFLIQNSQNRDSAALQMKLDELIRVQTEAKNSMMGLEDKEEKELEEIKKEFKALAEAEDGHDQKG